MPLPYCSVSGASSSTADEEGRGESSAPPSSGSSALRSGWSPVADGRGSMLSTDNMAISEEDGGGEEGPKVFLKVIFTIAAFVKVIRVAFTRTSEEYSYTGR